MMQIITYTPEVQQQAKELLSDIDAALDAEINRRSDEEGCGAFMNAYLYQSEIGQWGQE